MRSPLGPGRRGSTFDHVDIRFRHSNFPRVSSSNRLVRHIPHLPLKTPTTYRTSYRYFPPRRKGIKVCTLVFCPHKLFFSLLGVRETVLWDRPRARLFPRPPIHPPSLWEFTRIPPRPRATTAAAYSFRWKGRNLPSLHGRVANL